MAGSLDNALPMLTRLRARRRGRANLVLLGWLLLTQTALVVHRIDHNAAVDHNAVCAACVAADQSADVGLAPIFVRVPQTPARVAATLAESAGTRTPVPYRSRAPPERSRA